MTKQHEILIEFAKNLLNYSSIDEALEFISSEAKVITGADRCSIFIYNEKENLLWTKLADDTQRISVPFDVGIVGHTIRKAKPILENDPYDNTNFLSEIDMRSGYYTRNILTAPIFNSQRNVSGVIQLLNKDGGFDKKDIKFLSFFSHYISSYIELNTLNELTD